ncbi:phage tail assembly protein [Xanthomonas translucens]|uniref:phage tail assembly protein n=1 Tax=Xanthomonas campestris pv. translucens TaxID=343 RepID=UPI001F343D9A|nr:phage tail assembly protein [Xanthomonas translucens]UII65648.1 phage tail assembly protein [Xanthomonas translucens]
MSAKTPTFSNPVPLEESIVRGEQTITSVQVRKPGAGELRGAKLTDLLQMDVSALQLVLPRVTQPTLTGPDIAQLEPADLLALGGELVNFLLPKSERANVSPTA